MGVGQWSQRASGNKFLVRELPILLPRRANEQIDVRAVLDLRSKTCVQGQISGPSLGQKYGIN